MMYVVLKLYTEVEGLNPVNGEITSVKLGGCAGYLPVFKNIYDAEQSANNGKYEIVKIILK